MYRTLRVLGLPQASLAQAHAGGVSCLQRRGYEDWIYKELVREGEFLDGSSFEESLHIYLTPLANNFVSTIINGSGLPAKYKVNPGEFQYSHIIRKIAAVTENEASVWFCYCVIDNAVGELKEIWDCNYEFSLDYPLEKFEREPAEQGGVSFLGLLSKKNHGCSYIHMSRESLSKLSCMLAVV